MLPFRPLALGLAVVGVPLSALTLAARRSADAAPRPTAASRPWGLPDQASLNLVRRVAAGEARRSVSALAACEARARSASPGARRAIYRDCAFRPLARTGAAAATSSHLMTNLVAGRPAPGACLPLVRQLANADAILADLARAALRNAGATGWAGLSAGSRALRGLARNAWRAARDRGWREACAP
jgi:hypothetical protein